MSSYRGAWDGGPPGAEAEYAAPPPASAAPLPVTDPWTGARYAPYAAPVSAAYDYRQYSHYGPPAPYGYDPAYYQRADAAAHYYGKYPETSAYQPPSAQPSAPAYEYGAGRRRSRSPSPYGRRSRSRSRPRDVSPPEPRRRRDRPAATASRRPYSSSDRSTSRSHSRSRSSRDGLGGPRDKSRTASSDSEDERYRRSGKSKRNERSSSRSPRLRSRSESPGSPDSRSDRSSGRGRDARRPALKEAKDRKREASTPPRKKLESFTPPKGKKTDHAAASPRRRKRKDSDRDRSLTPPKSYKFKERKTNTPPRKPRDSSVTPPKSYARGGSTSSGESRCRRRQRRSSRSGSRSSSASRSSASSRASDGDRKRKRKLKRDSRSKSRSKPRSRSASSRDRSKIKGQRRSKSPGESKSRSGTPSHSSRSRSHSGTPSDDERRGQFTVADRKRFWKMHKSRLEERDREPRTPPKEVKPPPGAVEPTSVDDVLYGDPPDVEGPNFAELLAPPDKAMALAVSTSKTKPVPIPIKNDGSFLEMFKKMQEQTKKAEEAEKKPEIKKPAYPFIGKRRGGRVLKTGLVKKPKAIDEQTVENTPKDAWSLYMQEVKKYRETSCEEEPKMPEMIKSAADLKTAPFDPRFPNTNQTRHCYQSYLDFHRCQKVRGEKYEPCFYFQRVFKSLCPNEWVEKWDSQRDEGTFAGRI